MGLGRKERVSLPKNSSSRAPASSSDALLGFTRKERSIFPRNSSSRLPVARAYSSISRTSDEVPRYIANTFFLLGLGVRLPYNAITSSINFYEIAFPEVPVSAVSSLSYLVPMCLASLYYARSQKIRSAYVRDIIFGFAVFACVVMAFPALAPTEPESVRVSSGILFFILMSALVGLASAAIHACLFGVAALFKDGVCTKALLSGGGLAGVFISGLRVVPMLLSTSSSNQAESLKNNSQESFSQNFASLFVFFVACACVCFMCIAELIWVSKSRSWENVVDETVHDNTAGQQNMAEGFGVDGMNSITEVLREPFTAALLCLSTTVALYPAVLTDMGIISTAKLGGLVPQNWLAVLSVFLFSIGDLAGKSMNYDMFGEHFRSSRGMLLFSIARLLFFPVVFLAARGVIHFSGIGILALSCFLGVTNGICLGICMIIGPQMVSISNRDKAGKVMFLALVCGMALGALTVPFLKHFSIENVATAAGQDADGEGVGLLSRLWPGWRKRVEADRDFPFKVMMEETVGLGLAASGMIAARGKEILNELDFAFCDIAVGATLNFILVYLLSPTADISGNIASSKSSLFATLSDLPANLFAKGEFTPSQRLGGFLYKGTLFALCGFAGSIVGTTLSQGLITLRRLTASRTNGSDTSEKKLPNVLVNSAAWAGFMFLSSNPRYQAVAGLERFMFGYAPESFAKVFCGTIRTLNNVLGGAQWVMWAQYLGIQESEN